MVDNNNNGWKIVIRVVTFVALVALVVADKGMGLMKGDIPDLWYGILLVFVWGGFDGIKKMWGK